MKLFFLFLAVATLNLMGCGGSKNAANPAGSETCEVLGNCQPGELIWAKSFGDASSQTAEGVTVDGNQDVIVIGNFKGTLAFDPNSPLVEEGNGDIFLAKFNNQGNLLWSKRLGGDQGEFAYGLAVDSANNIIISGYFIGASDLGGGVLPYAGGTDAFIAKFDADGNHLWSKGFGDAGGQLGFRVTIDSLDTINFMGSFDGTINFGGVPPSLVSQGSDIFIIQFDSGGKITTAKQFGDSKKDFGTGIATDKNNEVLFTGLFNNEISFFSCGKLQSMGSDDIFLVKLTPPMNDCQTAKRFGDSNSQIARAIAMDSNDNVAITGRFDGITDFVGNLLISNGGGDVFVAKFDDTLNPLWNKRFGDGLAQDGIDTIFDNTDNLITTGTMKGQADFGSGPLLSAGGYDIFLVKLDSAGNFVWAKIFGDSEDQQSTAVNTDASENIFLTGSFKGAVDFGNGPLISAGLNDIFLAKFAP